MFEDLSDDFALHMFHGIRTAVDVVRRRYDASSVSSKRLRRAADMQALSELGRRIVVYELQGALTIFTVERLVRELLEIEASVDHLVVDFKRVSSIDGPALRLWLEFLRSLGPRFRNVILAEFDHDTVLVNGLRDHVLDRGAYKLLTETDAALELCEDAVLSNAAVLRDVEDRVSLEQFDVCAGLDAEQLRALRSVLDVVRYEPGDVIVRSGDPATALYFLVQGRVSVVVDTAGGGTRRLTTCVPGMLFGDMAVVERQPRSATVRADLPTECFSMSLACFDRLTATHTNLKVALLENFARSLSRRVRRLTNEVRALSG